MLISLKCGGVGLNLVEANRVIKSEASPDVLRFETTILTPPHPVAASTLLGISPPNLKRTTESIASARTRRSWSSVSLSATPSRRGKHSRSLSGV